MVTPAARREAAIWIREEREVSQRRACALANCQRSVARYVVRRDSQEELRTRLRELAACKPRYGYRRLTRLLNRAGLRVNDKRVYRLYKLEGLMVRRKKRKRIARAAQPALAPATAPNQRWNADFMEDSLHWGRKFRTFNVLDEMARECPAIEVDT